MLIVRKAAPGCSPRALARFEERARKVIPLRGKVNILLASSRDVRALNRRFRGMDCSTDVLSFPPMVWPEPPAPPRGLKTSARPEQMSGDIVISSEIAARNARRYGHHPIEEVKILILHGMLHLAGFDHESDGGRMAHVEERLRRELGLSDALIRRTERGVRSSGHGVRSPSSAARRRPR